MVGIYHITSPCCMENHRRRLPPNYGKNVELKAKKKKKNNRNINFCYINNRMESNRKT